MIGILINIKRCVIKNKALTKFINIFIKIYAWKTPKEIVRRESLSIFNYIDLAKPIKYYPFYNINSLAKIVSKTIAGRWRNGITGYGHCTCINWYLLSFYS